MYSFNMIEIVNFVLFDEYEDYNLTIRRNHQKSRIIKPRINYMKILNAKDFRRRFVISKRSFIMLLEKIYTKIQHKTNRNNAIPPIIQLMVALRFYATGSFFMTISDFCGISEASAHNIIHRVSSAIASLKKEFIKLPTLSEEICRNQQEFFQTAGFIRVGCMDCTHIKIQSYGGENNELYHNRKGYFSINVQVIINARMEIIDIVARWPGSTHDATIFNNSRIKMMFEIGIFGDGLLLGDSGYPNLSYIMTPILHPTIPAEHLYNEAQIRTRSKIERCFGIWKRRFPVLSIGTRFNRVERTLSVIVATAILHNIAQQEVILNPINPQIYNNVIAQMQHVNADDMNINNEKHAIVEYFNRLL